MSANKFLRRSASPFLRIEERDTLTGEAMRRAKTANHIWPCGQGGVTLIELLIALVLTAIIGGALYQGLVHQSKSFIQQDQTAEAMQHCREATEQILRELRMAGYGMSYQDASNNTVNDLGIVLGEETLINGTSVTTVGLTKSGTSMASPAAAGCAALIQNVDGTLKSWPEGCRAILLAGAKKNVAGKTWWQDVVADVDASDGAGAVDALEAVAITKQRRWRNASGTTKGWDVGTLRSSDIGSNKRTTFSYFVKLSSGVLAPRHVKVALAWDSKIQTIQLPFIGELLLGSSLTVDLDLQVFDSHGTQVGYSGSWDNSYEIAEFDGKPGETYTIKIRRWSGSDDVWYGIAWTVTGGLFWADVTRFTTLQRFLAEQPLGG